MGSTGEAFGSCRWAFGWRRVLPAPGLRRPSQPAQAHPPGTSILKTQPVKSRGMIPLISPTIYRANDTRLCGLTKQPWPRLRSRCLARPTHSQRTSSFTALEQPPHLIHSKSRLAPNSCSHGRSRKDTMFIFSLHTLIPDYLSKFDI